MSRLFHASVGQPRLMSALSALFGGLAGLLSMVGIYGVTLYNVRRQRREFGIRLALGAYPRTVRKLVVWRGLITASAGIALGASLVAFFLTRTLQAMLNDVKLQSTRSFTPGERSPFCWFHSLPVTCQRVRPDASIRWWCCGTTRVCVQFSFACPSRSRSPGPLASFPVPAEVVQPAVDLLQRFGGHRLDEARAFGSRGGEAAVPEHLEMLGDAGLRDAELALNDSDDLARRLLARRQQLEDASPDWIAQNVECVHQFKELSQLGRHATLRPPQPNRL